MIFFDLQRKYKFILRWSVNYGIRWNEAENFIVPPITAAAYMALEPSRTKWVRSLSLGLLSHAEHARQNKYYAPDIYTSAQECKDWLTAQATLNFDFDHRIIRALVQAICRKKNLDKNKRQWYDRRMLILMT